MGLKITETDISKSSLIAPRIRFTILISFLIVLVLSSTAILFSYWQEDLGISLDSVQVEADDAVLMQRDLAGDRVFVRTSNLETTDFKQVQPKGKALPQGENLPPSSTSQTYEREAPIKKGKVIQIILSTQRLLAWQDGRLLGNFLASTGKSSTPTKQGEFKVLTKLKMAYGAGDGQTWAMPYWLGFYVAGGTENGIHALPYIDGVKESSASLGTPVSHGCVRIADQNQIWLYNWAEIGAPVIVQWN